MPVRTLTSSDVAERSLVGLTPVEFADVSGADRVLIFASWATRYPGHTIRVPRVPAARRRRRPVAGRRRGRW